MAKVVEHVPFFLIQEASHGVAVPGGQQADLCCASLSHGASQHLLGVNRQRALAGLQRLHVSRESQL